MTGKLDDALRDYVAEAVVASLEIDDWPGVENTGVVVWSGPTLLIVQQVDDSVSLDGFATIQKASLCSIEEHRYASAYGRVLRARGDVPQTPGIDPADIDRLLQHFSALGTIVSVHESDGEVAWVGRIVGTRPEEIDVDLLDPTGVGVGVRSVPRSAVAMIEWGTRYLEAVAIMEVTSE